MKSILRFLGIEPGSDTQASTETETVRRITEKLEALPAEQARFFAAFAYILGRVANADLNITKDETRVMEEIVINETGLSEDEAILVVQMAKSQNRLFGGTEDFLVTREFARIANREEKLSLIRCAFRVSSSDLNVSLMEENEIRRITNELGIDHRDYVEVRREFRDKLAVLKSFPSEEDLDE